MTEHAGRPHWAPVVYGRTRLVDRWWRAVPWDVDDRWLQGSVTAVVAGGQRLREAPRFLLAQGRDDILVGVACRARELTTSMHSDGHRELYCFVGWTARRTDGVEPPRLGDLVRDFRAWASDEYEKWVGPDWERPMRDLREPHRTSPAPPPWPAAPLLGPEPPSDRSVAWPAASADAVWEGVRAAAAPVTVSTGWRAASDAPLRDVRVPVHIIADDVVDPYWLDHLAPLPHPVPPAGVSPPADPPEQEREGSGWGSAHKLRTDASAMWRAVKSSLPGDTADHDDIGSARERSPRRSTRPRPARPDLSGTREVDERMRDDPRRTAKVNDAFTFGEPGSSPASPQPRADPPTWSGASAPVGEPPDRPPGPGAGPPQTDQQPSAAGAEAPSAEPTGPPDGSRSE